MQENTKIKLKRKRNQRVRKIIKTPKEAEKRLPEKIHHVEVLPISIKKNYGSRTIYTIPIYPIPFYPIYQFILCQSTYASFKTEK